MESEGKKLRKKRQQKIKEDCSSLLAEIKKQHKGENLSSAEINKLFMKEHKKRSVEAPIEITDNDSEEQKEEEKKYKTTRSFKCSCGMHVTLEGSIADNNDYQKCSKCSKIA